MSISNYVSSKVVMARLYRELGLSTEISETEVIELIADALAMIGSHYQYDEIPTVLELDVNGVTKLPSNFYKLVSIRYKDNPLSWSTNAFVNDYECDSCEIAKCCTDYSFYISDGIIKTDIKATEPDNKLCISYLGVPVDEDGYPMVPDDIYYFKACVAYVTYIMDYREWRKGNSPDKVFKKSEQDWLFYVNSARGAANMPNVSQMENLKNIMIRLIPSVNQYTRNFKNINSPERRKRF